MKKVIVVYFTFLVFIGKRVTVFTEKKGQNSDAIKKVTGNAEGETFTLQTGKYTKIVRKNYHSFPFNDKITFRKLEIHIYVFDISTVCTGVSAYMEATLLIYNPFLFLPSSNSLGV